MDEQKPLEDKTLLESEESVALEQTLNEETLDDDLLAIEANDKLLESEDNFAVFEQEDGLIAWSLQNLYDEGGVVRSKKELRLDPAILRIEDGSGGSVDFLLTKEFTKSLTKSLETARLASYGIKKSRKPLESFKEAFVNSLIESPLRAILVVGLLIMVPFLILFT